MGHRRPAGRSVPPKNIIFKPLTLNGAILDDTNGEMTAVVGTVANPINYDWIVEKGTEIDIFHFHLVLIDGTVEASDFGAIATGLANGLFVQIITADGIIYDLTAGRTVKKNANWGLLAAGGISEAKGSGDDSLTVDWEVHGEDDILLKEGDRLRIAVRDDLTSLTSLKADVQARLYTVGGE